VPNLCELFLLHRVISVLVIVKTDIDRGTEIQRNRQRRYINIETQVETGTEGPLREKQTDRQTERDRERYVLRLV